MNNASGHTLADAVRGAPPETHRSEGGGVWAEYLPNAALTSNDLFLDDANALVPVWLGGRGDRPAFAMDATGFFGRYLFTVFNLLCDSSAAASKRPSQSCRGLDSLFLKVQSTLWESKVQPPLPEGRLGYLKSPRSSPPS